MIFWPRRPPPPRPKPKASNHPTARWRLSSGDGLHSADREPPDRCCYTFTLLSTYFASIHVVLLRVLLPLLLRLLLTIINANVPVSRGGRDPTMLRLPASAAPHRLRPSQHPPQSHVPASPMNNTHTHTRRSHPTSSPGPKHPTARRHDALYTTSMTGIVDSTRSCVLASLRGPGMMAPWHSGQYSLYLVNHSSRQRVWKACEHRSPRTCASSTNSSRQMALYTQ